MPLVLCGTGGFWRAKEQRGGWAGFELKTSRAIRDRQPVTPVIVISPIYASERERSPNALGVTVEQVREDVRETAAMLRSRGTAVCITAVGWAGSALKTQADCPMVCTRTRQVTSCSARGSESGC